MARFALYAFRRDHVLVVFRRHISDGHAHMIVRRGLGPGRRPSRTFAAASVMCGFEIKSIFVHVALVCALRADQSLGKWVAIRKEDAMGHPVC
jgi:hypothetical protein